MATQEYERREEVVPMRIYWNQVHSSKTRGHSSPSYTKEELVLWIVSQPIYKELYNDWRVSGFKSDLKPSCDRLDNSKGYSFGNIELVTWLENKRRANLDTKNGTLGSSLREVWQYTLDGVLITKYYSQAEAARKVVRADQRNISACCRGLLSQHARFRWFYSEQFALQPITADEDYFKTIYRYDSITGNILDVYPTIKFIDESVFNLMKVRNVIQGVYHTHATNYWSFKLLSPDEVTDTVDTRFVPRSIQQLTLEGVLLNTFISMSAASKTTGIRSGNISKCCNDKAKSAGGFLWKRE